MKCALGVIAFCISSTAAQPLPDSLAQAFWGAREILFSQQARPEVEILPGRPLSELEIKRKIGLFLSMCPRPGERGREVRVAQPDGRSSVQYSSFISCSKEERTQLEAWHREIGELDSEVEWLKRRANAPTADQASMVRALSRKFPNVAVENVFFIPLGKAADRWLLEILGIARDSIGGMYLRLADGRSIVGGIVINSDDDLLTQSATAVHEMIHSAQKPPGLQSVNLRFFYSSNFGIRLDPELTAFISSLMTEGLTELKTREVLRDVWSRKAQNSAFDPVRNDFLAGVIGRRTSPERLMKRTGHRGDIYEWESDVVGRLSAHYGEYLIEEWVGKGNPAPLVQRVGGVRFLALIRALYEDKDADPKGGRERGAAAQPIKSRTP